MALAFLLILHWDSTVTPPCPVKAVENRAAVTLLRPESARISPPIDNFRPFPDWMPQFHLHRHWNACGSARCVTMDSSCWHLWASSQVFRTHWPFWMILWFCDLVWLSSKRPSPPIYKWFCSSNASWGLFLFCVWVSINQGCIDLEATLGYKTHVAATALHLECGASLCSCHWILMGVLLHCTFLWMLCQVIMLISPLVIGLSVSCLC